MDVRNIANVIASTLAEDFPGEDIPEGHLYVPFMAYGLDPFQAAVGVLVGAGLLERRPGPCLRTTKRLLDVVAGLKAKASA